MSFEVVSPVARETPSPLPRSRLMLLFVVALLLFCVLRWDGDQWLQLHLLPRLAAEGVHAVSVERDSVQLRLQGVTIDGVEFAGQPVRLEQLVVAPEWGELLKLHLAARVSMRWQQADAEAQVVRRDATQLAIRDLHLALPFSMMHPLLPVAMPVSLAGDIVCRGALGVSLLQFQPRQPDIACDWQRATAVMGKGKPVALGSYHLTLRGAESAWQWTLRGGEVAKVEGKGAVHPADGVAMRQWLVDGSLTVHSGKGALGAMVGSLLGTRPHTIGGHLGAPIFR